MASPRSLRNASFVIFAFVCLASNFAFAYPEYQAEGPPGCGVIVIGEGTTEEEAEGECAQWCDIACNFANDGYGSCDGYIDGDGEAESCTPMGGSGSYTAVGACACYQVPPF